MTTAAQSRGKAVPHRGAGLEPLSDLHPHERVAARRTGVEHLKRVRERLEGVAKPQVVEQGRATCGP